MSDGGGWRRVSRRRIFRARRRCDPGPPFALPKTDMQMLWHGRAHLDPAHKWLRGLLIRAAEGI